MGISHAGVGYSFEALETNATSPYFQYPFSLATLPKELEWGLIAPGLAGLLSVISCFSLLCFLIWRFINWRQHAKTYLGYNQYLVLFINLLVADLQQALSFTFSFHWMRVGGIHAPTSACFAQGWLLNIGNVSSAFFVLFIAGHTFYTTVKGRRLDYRIFLGLILFVWFISLLLTLLGPSLYGRRFFVRTGAWCWVSALYETERLALHYIWIFLVQFGAMAIYLAVLVHIKTTMRRTTSIVMTSSVSSAHAKIDRAARSMVLYPVFYILLTLPLSAGRMWSLAHGGAFLPNSYLLVAGTMMGSSGFIDALLYALTRKQLMHSGSTVEQGGTQGSTMKDRRKSSFASAAVAVLKPGRPGVQRSKSYNPTTGGAGGLGVGRMAAVQEKVGLGGEDEKKGIRMQRCISVAVPDDYINTMKTKRSSSVPVLPRHGFGAEDGASSDGDAAMESREDVTDSVNADRDVENGRGKEEVEKEDV